MSISVLSPVLERGSLLFSVFNVLKSWIKRKPSLLKTLYFNLRYFPMPIAIKTPVWVSHFVVLKKCQGKIILPEKIYPGMIELGFGYVPVFDKKRIRTIWNNNGVVKFKGKCVFKHGARIGNGGVITFGNEFHIAPESLIICEKEIVFGDFVSVSWRCQIMDSDYHELLQNGKRINKDKQIRIGNHVWIGNNCLVKKGTHLPDNVVVVSGSVVTGTIDKRNTVIGGVPAKPIKKSINWKR